MLVEELDEFLCTLEAADQAFRSILSSFVSTLLGLVLFTG
jgi:hypothetical protein